MSEPQSETPEPFRIELIEANSKLARCERELTTEREAKLEYLRRDAERDRQLVAEREARVKAERERDEALQKAVERDEDQQDAIIEQEKEIAELNSELATLRVTREQDHGAAIETAAYDCSVEIERPLLWVVEIIARHMHTLVTTITKQ